MGCWRELATAPGTLLCMAEIILQEAYDVRPKWFLGLWREPKSLPPEGGIYRRGKQARL
jgi:hypothetical protein